MDDVALPADAAASRLAVRAFLSDSLRPVEERAGREQWGRDEWRRAMTELAREARERRLWAPHLPPSWGGSGHDAVSTAVVLAEAAASRLASAALNVRSPDVRTADALLHHGDDDQRRTWLAPLGDGRLSSGHEPMRPGRVVPALRADRVADGWRISGGPLPIVGVEGAGVVLLTATTEAGPTAFCFAPGGEGWELGPPVSVLGADVRSVRCHGLAVPRDAVVGPEGEGTEVAARGSELVTLARCLRWQSLAAAVVAWLDRALTGAPREVLAAHALGAARAETAVEVGRLVVRDLVDGAAAGTVRQRQLTTARVTVGETFTTVVDRALAVESALVVREPLPVGVLRQARWARVAGGAPEDQLAARAARWGGEGPT